MWRRRPPYLQYLSSNNSRKAFSHLILCLFLSGCRSPSTPLPQGNSVPGPLPATASSSTPPSKTLSESDKSAYRADIYGADREDVSHIPIYPGAKAPKGANAFSVPMGANGLGMQVLETTDAPDKVIAFYKSILKNPTRNTRLQGGVQVVTLLEQRPDGSLRNVRIFANPGETDIELMALRAQKNGRPFLLPHSGVTAPASHNPEDADDADPSANHN